MDTTLRKIWWTFLLVGLVSSSHANAATNTWKGAANGDWFNVNNWTALAVPLDGDDVVVTNSSILLTSSTANLASFIITNSTITFRNWTTALNATNVVIRKLGKLTHTACTSTSAMSNRVYVVGSNMTVEVGGSILANGLGYAGSTTGVRGEGPGGGYAGQDGGGGGYGGVGGGGEGEANGGPAAGTADDASCPGSGGGGSTRNGIVGGAGGGAVYCDLSGTMALLGSIQANGTYGATGAHSGQGSGGGITVLCNTFNASAGSSIMAEGGTGLTGCYGGGGGGGRIVLSYTQVTPGSVVDLSADYGVRAPSGQGNPGSIGSINVPNSSLLAETRRMNGAFYGLANWGASQLYFTNSHLAFRTSGFVLTVTNDVVLGQDAALDINLARSLFRVDGNLTLTNSALLTLRSGATNATGFYTNCGGRLSVGGTYTVGAGCTNIMVPQRSELGALRCDVGSMSVAAGGVIHADYLGCWGALTANTKGSGTGGGNAGGLYGAGAGYGGAGGKSFDNLAAGGIVYGDSNAPVRCGSGGGTRTASGNNGYGNGGGVVWVESPGTIQISGTVSVKGESGYDHNGCGSGGSIYLTSDTFSGGAAGKLDAHGGDTAGDIAPYNDTHGGGGGGGRIAIYRRADTFIGTVNVVGGTSISGNAGANGTLVRANPPGAVYVDLSVLGSPAARGTPTPAYGASGYNVGSFVTNTVNSPADEANGLRYSCMGWTVTNSAGFTASGVSTQAVVQMTTNASITWYWTNVYQLITTAAVNGSLQVDRSAWYTNGTTVTMTAVPDSGYYFVRWSGDCPVGSDANNPLTVTMNQRRTLMAQFASSAGQTKVWSGTGNWYSNSVNWSPVGAPGTGDTVVVSSGTVTLTDPAVMASLTVSNTGVVQARGVLSRYDLVVAGSVNLEGASARLSVTNANLLVGGNLMLTNGAVLGLTSGPTNLTTPVYGGLLSVGGTIGVATTATINVSSDPTNGGSFKMVTGALLLNGGKINADATGWQGGTASHTEGYGPGHGHYGTYGGGAGYGGNGGDALTQSGAKGVAYGLSNAPALPGSGGAYYAATVTAGGRGGGLVWVETLGRVTLGGTITANGADGLPHAGAGSGGGIYIQCGYLSGDTSGWLLANGGGVGGGNPGGGNGSGGRIAVKCGVLLWGSTNQVSVTGGTGGVQSYMYGQVGTIYWELGPQGTVYCLR